jgi:hypothetical protein
MNRREFVLAGTTSLWAGPLLAGAHAQASVAGTSQIPLDAYRILYDRRFAASRTFGAQIARRGGAARAIEGDVTELWLDDLAPRWSLGGGVVAGMTTRRTLLCLEHLAWDHRLHVTMRIAHESFAQSIELRPVTADALVTWVIAA